jgi:hypothetical protein
MNARIERAVNSENLGTIITENEVLDQKIWTLEAFGGKTVFSGVIWGNSGILEWLESLGVKARALAKFGNFWGIFVDFWSVWSALVPFCKYFLEAEGPAVILPSAQG